MNISVEELNKKNKYNTLNIIDIRDEHAYSYGHIVNSKNIPASTLIASPEKYLKRDQIYYIYCQAGKTSKQVVTILNQRGYHTYSVNGGYNNYLLWK